MSFKSKSDKSHKSKILTSSSVLGFAPASNKEKLGLVSLEPRILLDAAGFVRPHGNLHAIACAELVHEARQVRFHRAEADVQLVRDFFVRVSRCHRKQHLFLTIGE